MRDLLLTSAASLGLVLAAGGAAAQPVQPAAPGTVSWHVDGFAQVLGGVFGSSFNKVRAPGGTDRLEPVGSVGLLRVDPGFDGATAGGLRYGMQADLLTGYSNMGIGRDGRPNSDVSLESIYLRRGYGYLGLPAAGTVRLGLTDSAFTLLQTGVVEGFGDGGQWTLEGGVRDLLPAAAAPVRTFIYADQVALYATPKLVYLSPDFGGVKFEAGYEPRSTGLKQEDDLCTGANSLCAGPLPTDTRGDAGKRRQNTVDGAAQYTLQTNGFLIKAMAGFLYGTPIGTDTGVPAATAAGPAALARGYNALAVYQAGAQVTYAGLTLGANIKGGQVEDAYALQPKGGRDAFAYSLGVSYAIGPVVVGASYFNAQSAGSFIPGATGVGTNGAGTVVTAATAHGVARTLSEYGVAVGGNYLIGPHLSLFTQYMLGHRHQPGNLALSNSGNGQAAVVAAGAALKW